MALERRDLRVYFDADVYAALRELADEAGLKEGAYVESLVEPIIRKTVHDTMMRAERFRQAGIFRLSPVSPPGQCSSDD
jgi:hypothetical protein